MTAKYISNKALSALLVACLSLTMFGCQKAAKTKQVGSDYFGYMTIPEGLREATDELIEAEIASGVPAWNYERIDMLFFESEDEEINVSIIVHKVTTFRELYSELQSFTNAIDTGSSQVQTISLAGGQITQVVRTTDSNEAENNYYAEYLLEGSDGLARRISIKSKSEEQQKELMATVEDTYTLPTNLQDVRLPVVGGIEEQVILNHDGVVITLLRYEDIVYMNSYGDKVGNPTVVPSLVFMIDNNSPVGIRVHGERPGENGKYSGNITTVDIPSGRSLAFNLGFNQIPLDDSVTVNIGEAYVKGEIEFSMRVLPVDENRTIVETGTIVLGVK